jgi:putative heme-binding domain-containing protein
MNRRRIRLIASVAICAFAAAGPRAAQLHIGEYSAADVQRGAQLFSTRCTTCHGDAGDQVPGVSLLSGKFRRASSDEDLAAVIKNGIPAMGMPQGNYSAAELTGLVAYLRSAPAGRSATADATAAAVGDPRNGSTIFFGKGECAGCHRVRGVGGFRGPNLSNVGETRSPDSLRQSLLTPSSEIIPLNQEIRAVTRTGRAVTGRRMNEDTSSIQLIDPEGHLISLIKSDVKELTPLKVSAMPSYQDRLTPGELSDVLAYLRSLKPGN